MANRYTVLIGDPASISGGASGNTVRFPWGTDFNAYPSEVGPLTLGTDDGATGQGSAPGWAAGKDERARYLSGRSNEASPFDFYINAPEGPGTYRVWLVAPRADFIKTRWTLRDGIGGTQRWQRTWTDALFSGSSYDQFVCNDSPAIAPIPADITVVVAPLELVLDSGVLALRYGDHPDGNFGSIIASITFEKIPVGPDITAVSPSVGRATGTEITITVDDSTGVTAAAINGVPLAGLTIVNATTIRGTTAGATTGPVSVTNASGTAEGPAFTVVPVANAFRLVGAAPWAPAAGPTFGVPYTLTLEAYNIAADARDTLFTDAVTLIPEMVSGDPTTISSGAGPVSFAAGEATYTGVVFAEAAVVPPPIDPPVVVPTRNRVVTTRARSLPGGEDARLREQYNRMVQKLTALCDLLDADASVAGTGFAAAFVDAPDAPRLIADESGAVR